MERTPHAEDEVFSGPLASVIKAFDDPAIACRPDGRLAIWNFSFAALHTERHGRQPAVTDHVHALDVDTPAQRALLQGFLDQAVAGERAREIVAFGDWQIDMRARPLHADSGAVAGVLMIFHMLDHAERVIAERDEALLKAQVAASNAERANRAKSAFLSRMSHELRTPLNAILGFGQILETEVLGESRQHVGHIIDAGQHLLGLIDEILDLARLEAGHISVSPATVDAREALQDVAVLLAPVAVDAGVTISLPDTPEAVWVSADPQRLKQVVINLVGNAIKYGASGGTCTLGLREGPGADQVTITVVDRGPGVAADQHERLFAPFDRLDAEGSAVPGSGLGLALSRGLVEAMGGRLDVESEEGRGTTCLVTLQQAVAPAALAPEVARTRSARLQSAATSGTVLYIEDNPSNVRLVESILGRRPGVTLSVATDGGIGLRLAQQSRPGLILLDMHLPGLDGEEVLASLRMDHRTADLPVAVVSADATPDRIARLREAGVRDYLTKPIDVARFLEVLDDALGAPGPLRVLVADDAPIGRQIAERLLAAAGHEVVSVADGQEAVEAVAAADFDLVLLDQEMPRLDGIGAATAISAARTGDRPRLLLLTAHDERDLPADLAARGIERVITKPLTRAIVTGLSAGEPEPV